MKFLIFFSLFATTFFTSCRKEYTCICKNNISESTIITINDSKKNAKKKCDANNDSTTPGLVISCTLQ